MSTINRFLIAGLLFSGSAAMAASGQKMGFALGVEPIIGYEQVQKVAPTPHTTSRLTYGVRITAGIPLLAAEAEYTIGQNTEAFPAADLTIKDKSDAIKVGLRTGLNLSSIVRLTGRGGVRAQKNIHTETTSTTNTVTTQPLTYDPYGGAGLRVRLTPKITGSAEVVAIFTDWPHMDKNEYQTTAGFEVSFP
jgi:hypothetical protein